MWYACRCGSEMWYACRCGSERWYACRCGGRGKHASGSRVEKGWWQMPASASACPPHRPPSAVLLQLPRVGTRVVWRTLHLTLLSPDEHQGALCVTDQHIHALPVVKASTCSSYAPLQTGLRWALCTCRHFSRSSFFSFVPSRLFSSLPRSAVG